MNNNNKTPTNNKETKDDPLTCAGFIRQEIIRFEHVHPNIYAIYELIENLNDESLQAQIRDHVISVEDAFVNSQEWTLSRSVSEVRIGILGSVASGKSSLVHRYLTGTYINEESPEGGRFKKATVIEGQTHLLLLRDEAGPPQQQFSSWLDAVVMVFSLTSETSFQTLFSYFRKLSQFRDLSNIPIILVGTQDQINGENVRVISDEMVKKIANEKLKYFRYEYLETCSTYGLNVDQVFQQITRAVVLTRHRAFLRTSSVDSMMTSTPIRHSQIVGGGQQQFHQPQGGATQQQHFSNSAYELKNFANTSSSAPHVTNNATNHHHHSANNSDTENSLSNFFTPNQSRKSLRQSKKSSNIFMNRKTSESGDEKKRNSAASGHLLMTSHSGGFGRDIPVKQGYLMKKSNKYKIGKTGEWKKKFVALDQNGSFSYFNTINDYMENIHKQTIHILQTTTKLPGRHSSSILNISNSISSTSVNHDGGGGGATSSGGHHHHHHGNDENCQFQIILIRGSIWHFQAPSEVERDSWIEEIEKMYIHSLQQNNKNLSTTSNNNSTNSISNNNQITTSSRRKLKLYEMNNVNSKCVECGNDKSTWASLNLGCLICIECSGIHRKLGTHISRVRSLELDDWPPEYLGLLKRIGNQISKSVWEYDVTVDKINCQSSNENREKFIRDKYERRKYLAPLPNKYKQDISGALVRAINESDSKTFIHLLAYCKSEDINRKVGPEQRAPIHVSSFLGDLSFCQLLLWMNADTNIVDGKGETPQEIAQNQHHFECVRILKTYSNFHNNKPLRHIVTSTSSSATTSSSGNSELHPHQPSTRRNLMYTSAI